MCPAPNNDELGNIPALAIRNNNNKNRIKNRDTPHRKIFVNSAFEKYFVGGFRRSVWARQFDPQRAAYESSDIKDPRCP
jgi:hypothetical protein